MLRLRTTTRLILLLVLVTQAAWSYELGRVRRDSSDRSDRLHAGEVVLVVDRNGKGEALVMPGQTYVSPRLPKTVRIPQSNLEPLSTRALGMARLEDPEGSVNLRRDGDLRAPVVRAIPTRQGGACVFILEDGEWSRVLTPAGELGYIHTSRLVPVVMAGGAEEERADLVRGVLEARPRDSEGTGYETAYLGVGIGRERYLYDLSRGSLTRVAPLDKSLGRFSAYPGWTGIYGDWALVSFGRFGRDGSGAPQLMGAASWIMHREHGRWVLRGDVNDRGVTGLVRGSPPALPEEFRRVFQLYYYPE